MTLAQTNKSNILSKLYLASFLSSCFLFWWLPSLYYIIVLRLPNPVSSFSMYISIVSAFFYLVGYFILPTIAPIRLMSDDIINGCEQLSKKMTMILFLPSLIYAVYFCASHFYEKYGEYSIPFAGQGLFYAHLFFGFMFLSTIRPEKHSKKAVVLVFICIILPRIIVSLHYGRVFIAFGVLPMLFIAIARGWLNLTIRKVVCIILLGVSILIVPSIFRGDFKNYSSDAGSEYARNFIGVWLLAGSSLNVFDRFYNSSILGFCPPILVSFTEQMIPYKILGICTVPQADGTRVANADAIATYMINGDSYSRGGGTGSTYILDLYWFNGIMAIIIGSIILGSTCKLFIGSVGYRSVFSGIWAECLVRSLFIVRGTYGYMYQRIPSLVFATILCALIVRAALRVRGR
jgi:hypothetical protein